MIKIVSFKICPFVQRVTALLEAKDIPYEIDYISLSNKPGWFLELSPNGQVPVLIAESGQALFESDAIVEYIDEISPPLETNVNAEQRAINRAWGYQAAKAYLSQCSTMRSSNDATLAERHVNLAKTWQKAEQQLDEGPFFNGATLSNVDIAWLPLLHRAAVIKAHSGYDLLEGFPKVIAWQAALLTTGLAEKSVAEDFEETFTRFYLSEKTYLGQKSQGLSLSNNCAADNACASRHCC